MNTYFLKIIFMKKHALALVKRNNVNDILGTFECAHFRGQPFSGSTPLGSTPLNIGWNRIQSSLAQNLEMDIELLVL